MYNSHKIHVEELVKNIIKVIEQVNEKNIKIEIQSEADFKTEEERKLFYKITTKKTNPAYSS